jgi:putative inorganic carbon (hco3(-)) transporter
MILLYILAAILQLENHHVLGADLFAGLTIFKLVGAGCVPYALWYLSTRKQPVIFLETWQARLFLVFYALVTASYIFETRGGSLMQGSLMRFTSILLLFVIVMATVDSLHKLRIVLLCTITSVGIAGFYLFKEWFQYRNVFGSDFRPNGASLDSNYYALSAAACLPIAFCLLMERKSKWQRLICLANIGLMMAGFLAAASRGGLLALGTALLALCWFSKQRVRYFTLLTVVIVPAMVLSPSSPIRRLTNPDYGDKIGEESRKITWMAGVRMAVENPLTGVGVGNFKSVVLSYQPPGANEVKTLAHNTYVEVGAEMGFPGLIVFLAIILFTLLTVNDVRRRTKRAGPLLLHQAALGIETSVIGCLVGMIFLTAHWEKLLWLLVFLSSSMVPILRQSKLSAAAAAKRSSRTRKDPPEAEHPAFGRQGIDAQETAENWYSPSGVLPEGRRRG